MRVKTGLLGAAAEFTIRNVYLDPAELDSV